MCVFVSLCVFVCVSECIRARLYCMLLFCVCMCVFCECAYLVRRVVGGKRLTFPHSWGHLGHARG